MPYAPPAASAVVEAVTGMKDFGNTNVPLNADGVIVSDTPTLPAGRYYVVGYWHISAGGGGDYGSVVLQFDGSTVDRNFGRNNNSLDQPMYLDGFVDYEGGTPTIRLWFDHEGGGTVTFGTSNDGRFSARIRWMRVGDIPAA